jgi:hypothetical protein
MVATLHTVSLGRVQLASETVIGGAFVLRGGRYSRVAQKTANEQFFQPNERHATSMNRQSFQYRNNKHKEGSAASNVKGGVATARQKEKI